MVEIFSTNVVNESSARILQGLMSISFPGYQVNFDLFDVDKILRVESLQEPVNRELVTDYLKTLGVEALPID